MTNLQAVQIRAYGHKIVGQEKQARGISLTGTDFEDCEIRGLRPKLFQPATFTGSASFCILNLVLYVQNLLHHVCMNPNRAKWQSML